LALAEARRCKSENDEPQGKPGQTFFHREHDLFPFHQAKHTRVFAASPGCLVGFLH
jgi:hypothetical protein